MSLPFNRRLGIGLVVLGLLAWAGLAWHRSLRWEGTDNAFVTGRILPISSRVAGPVARVLVEDNQVVEKGQLLVELDPSDFQVQVAKAEAALASAEERYAASRESVDLTRVTGGGAEEQAQGALAAATSGVGTAEANVQTLRSRLGQAGPEVETARAQASQAEAQVGAARAALAQARAQVGAAEAEANRTRADEARYKALFAEQEVSQQALDQAHTAAVAAQARLVASREAVNAARAQLAAADSAARAARNRVEQARAALQAATSQVQQAEAQVAEARSRVAQARGALASASSVTQQVAVGQAQSGVAAAEVKAARAVLDQARLNLGYTKIAATSKGRITRKSVEVGTFVQPGQALMNLVPEDAWVVANFKETQLEGIRPGNEAEVKVDAFPGLVFHGRVDSLQEGTGAVFSLLPPENASGNFVKVVQRVPVKIVFSEGQEALLDQLAPGMSVEASVRTAP